MLDRAKLGAMQRPDPKSAHYKAFLKFQKKLAERIVTLRKEHDYSQEDMTEFELSLRQYQRMEQDPTAIVSLWQVFKIAKVFDIDVCDLLDN